MSKGSYYKFQSTEQEAKRIFGRFEITSGSLVAAPAGVPAVSGKGIRAINSPQVGVFNVSCSNPPGGSGQNATYVSLLDYNVKLVQSGVGSADQRNLRWSARDLLPQSGTVVLSCFDSGSNLLTLPSGSVVIFSLDVDASKFFAF